MSYDSGSPGFSNYLRQYGYSNENDILSILPNMDPIQQVKLDINLNMNAIDSFPNSNHLLVSNSKDKKNLIPFFQGKIKDPNTIKQLIQVVENSKRTHQNRVANQLTGSSDWNNTWIKVYDKWLKKLYGAINGQREG